ncbi:MAG: AAA family ATPase [Candidatus Dependentiae bacterium]
MSKFIIILGPPAVGKMTVGHELAKKTDLKVFHNHLIIDALLPLFDFESESYKKLVKEFRTRIFEEAIRSKLTGIIFTYVVAYNRPSGMQQLNEWISLFKENDFDVNIVELHASIEERLRRNETPHRLSHKHSKRDIDISRHILLKNEKEWDMEPKEGIFGDIPYLKLNTNELNPEETAQIISKHFQLAENQNESNISTEASTVQ